MKLAVVFPGQGSQSVGMGRDWFAQHPSAASTFHAADARLGFELSALCFEGPEDQLRRTANTQPAILATSWAIWDCIRDQLPQPAFFAGHSLGEYTALVAADALEFGDALALVRERGRLMQEAVPVGEGAMAAVIGLDVGQVEVITARIAADTGRPIEVANYNSREQVVVSGAADAVADAMPQYSAAGAKRVVELPVSAPFHSSLMAPVSDSLLPMLTATNFSAAGTAVVANLTAQPYPADPLHYPLVLAAQIVNSVRWTQSVEYLADQGVSHLLEVGPGKVLRTLTPKITDRISAANVASVGDLDGVLAWLREAAAA